MRLLLPLQLATLVVVCALLAGCSGCQVSSLRRPAPAVATAAIIAVPPSLTPEAAAVTSLMPTPTAPPVAAATVPPPVPPPPPSPSPSRLPSVVPPPPTATRLPSGTRQPAPLRPPAATPGAFSSAMPTVDPQYAMRLLCFSTIMDSRSPLPGQIVRRQAPVAINGRGIARVLDAITDIEAKTGSLITFQIVDKDPAVGITIVEGDAVDANGGPGCGNVTDSPDPTSGHRYKAGANGLLNTLVYVHLGSSTCNDASTGYQPYSIAAHEIAHALGVGRHFTGFNGDEGISPELAEVLVRLYSLPPGMDVTASCLK